MYKEEKLTNEKRIRRLKEQVNESCCNNEDEVNEKRITKKSQD